MPNCGGELIFDPKSQKYKCEYCGSDFCSGWDQYRRGSDTGGIRCGAGAWRYLWQSHTAKNSRCWRCGSAVYLSELWAQIVTDQTTAATFCYYCHNPVLLSEQLSGAFHPDQIIPFEIDRKQAEEHFLDFVQKKKFVPNCIFFRKIRLKNWQGIYFPYWVCDAEVGRKPDRRRK